MVTFAERFREIRGPLSQRKLQPLLDVTDKTIREWEKGESEPRLGSLLKIADATGLTLDYICGRVDERAADPAWWPTAPGADDDGLPAVPPPTAGDREAMRVARRLRRGLDDRPQAPPGEERAS